MATIINAEGLVLGRMATDTAKRLLKGDEVIIINAGQAVISGAKRTILDEETAKRDRGSNIRQGPFYRRVSRDYVKRTIRGMLPKTARGREALARLKVYSGQPQGMEANTELAGARVEKLPYPKFLTIDQITKSMGGRQ